MAEEKTTYDLLAVTGCPTGIAHTYMAKEALEKAAAAKGLTIKVETQGQVGAENEVTPAEIKACKAVIIAADKDVQPERFEGKPLISVGVTAAIKDPEGLIDKALAAKAEGELSAEVANASEDAAPEKESVGPPDLPPSHERRQPHAGLRRRRRRAHGPCRSSGASRPTTPRPPTTTPSPRCSRSSAHRHEPHGARALGLHRRVHRQAPGAGPRLRRRHDLHPGPARQRRDRPHRRRWRGRGLWISRRHHRRLPRRLRDRRAGEGLQRAAPEPERPQGHVPVPALLHLHRRPHHAGHLRSYGRHQPGDDGLPAGTLQRRSRAAGSGNRLHVRV